MKFRELSESDKVEFAEKYRDNSTPYIDRIDYLSNKFNINPRTVNRWVKKLDIYLTEPESDQYEKAKERVAEATHTYIITWAQNATPVHKEFWANVKAYADYLNASIHVIAGRYKNPTSIWTNDDRSDEWWHSSVVSYLDANRHTIADTLVLSDVKVRPTAKYPLSGLYDLSRDGNVIVGHPKLHMMSLPVFPNYPNKFMHTTGAVTIKNYTDSKSGKIGEVYHKFGFAILEVDGDETYIRQVEADENGEFYDLWNYVQNQTVSKVDRIDGIVMGDVHKSQLSQTKHEAALDLMSKLRPANCVLHDLLDGQSISHHDRKDPVLTFHKLQDNRTNLYNEIQETLDWLEAMLPYSPVIVSSNHNDWLDRYIRNQDWRNDLQNAQIYSELLLAAIQNKAPNGLVNYLIDERFEDSVVTLGRRDSMDIHGWELSMHGDQGQNGARGSVRQFSKIGEKAVLGHYHAPERINDTIAVGTSTELVQHYHKGPSNNAHCDAIIHPNGMAQQIIYRNGRYTVQ